MDKPTKSGRNAHMGAIKNIAYLIHSFGYSDDKIQDIIMDAKIQVDAWISDGHPKENKSEEGSRKTI